MKDGVVESKNPVPFATELTNLMVMLQSFDDIVSKYRVVSSYLSESGGSYEVDVNEKYYLDGNVLTLSIEAEKKNDTKRETVSHLYQFVVEKNYISILSYERYVKYINGEMSTDRVYNVDCSIVYENVKIKPID